MEQLPVFLLISKLNCENNANLISLKISFVCLELPHNFSEIKSAVVPIVKSKAEVHIFKKLSYLLHKQAQTELKCCLSQYKYLLDVVAGMASTYVEGGQRVASDGGLPQWSDDDPERHTRSESGYDKSGNSVASSPHTGCETF